MDVRTRTMRGNCDLTVEDDGTIVLWLRDGMLPRATVYEIGTLMGPVHGTVERDSARP